MFFFSRVLEGNRVVYSIYIRGGEAGEFGEKNAPFALLSGSVGGHTIDIDACEIVSLREMHSRNALRTPEMHSCLGDDGGSARALTRRRYKALNCRCGATPTCKDGARPIGMYLRMKRRVDIQE